MTETSHDKTESTKTPKTATQSLYHKIAIGLGAFVFGAFATSVLGVVGLYFMLLAPLNFYSATYESEPWQHLNIRSGQVSEIEALGKIEKELKQFIQNEDTPIQAQYLLASLQERQFQNKEALQSYETLLSFIHQSSFNEIAYQYFLKDIKPALLRLHFLNGQGERYLERLKKNQEDLTSEAYGDNLSQSLLNVLEYPKRADYRMLLAESLHQNLDLLEAQKEYQNALQLSQDPQLKQEAQMALRSKFPKNLETLPKEVLSWMKIADNLEVNQGDTEKARNIYQAVVQKAPTFEWGWFHLAQTLKELDKPSEAIEFGQKAIQLNPEYPLPYLLLGDLALDHEFYDEALKHFSKALSLSPVNQRYGDSTVLANVENQIGYCHEQLKQLDKAQHHFENAMKRLDEHFKISLRETAAAEDWDNFDMEATLDDYRAKDEDYQYAQEALSRLKDTRQSLSIKQSLSHH